MLVVTSVKWAKSRWSARGGKRVASIAAVLGALFSFTPARAQRGGGFVEVRAHTFAGVTGDDWLLVERVRPNFSLELRERLVLSATIEAAWSQGRCLQREVQRTLEASEVGPLLDAAGCEWPQPTNRTLGVSEVGDYLMVDRLHVDLYLPWADVRVGRQAVQWGSAFFINPTDPFPEVLLADPWRPRAGVNAARVTVPIGDAHQVQALLGTNDAFTKIQAAIRGTVGIGEADVSVSGAWRQELGRGVIGLDIRGNLELGYWLEAALNVDNGTVYEELAVGVDYSFAVLERLVVIAQFYRNGASGGDQDSFARLRSSVELPDCDGDFLLGTDGDGDRFAPVLTSHHYAILSAQLAVDPELSLTALWVQNLSDGSALFVPTVSYAWTGWLTVAGAAQIPLSAWGDGGELRPSEEDLVVVFDEGPSAATVDTSGLVPSATVIVWTRVNF